MQGRPLVCLIPIFSGRYGCQTCRQGILAGTVLAFARALGEYGATSMLIGYIPGKTATISTTVYQFWRTNDEAGAFVWVMVNLGISTVILLVVNMLETRNRRAVKLSSLVDVSKDYGSFQLKVQLEHSQGILGMLGASGSGKSMTLKLIAGILTPDKGRIVLNDQVLFDSEKRINLPPQKRRVGYLFQNYALFPNMTVEKNILCGLHREKNSTQRKKKLLEITELFQIQELLGQYPAQLSGGQQQRVALARILVSEPELLLLDEPFSALDSYFDQLQIQILEILKKLQRDVIFVSHSRDEVYHLCNQVALIDGGQILEKGNTKEVFANPGSRIGAALTGCKNIAAAVKTGEYMR